MSYRLLNILLRHILYSNQQCLGFNPKPMFGKQSTQLPAKFLEEISGTVGQSDGWTGDNEQRGGKNHVSYRYNLKWTTTWTGSSGFIPLGQSLSVIKVIEAFDFKLLTCLDFSQFNLRPLKFCPEKWRESCLSGYQFFPPFFLIANVFMPNCLEDQNRC